MKKVDRGEGGSGWDGGWDVWGGVLYFFPPRPPQIFVWSSILFHLGKDKVCFS